MKNYTDGLYAFDMGKTRIVIEVSSDSERVMFTGGVMTARSLSRDDAIRAVASAETAGRDVSYPLSVINAKRVIA